MRSTTTGGSPPASQVARYSTSAIVAKAIDRVFGTKGIGGPAALRLPAVLGLAVVAGSLQAADLSSAAVVAPAVPKKPAWLTELSVGLKETYDNNVFASGVDSADRPPYVVPDGSVAALDNESSWVTTISPKVGVNFAPLIGKQTAFQAITLGYAPDFATYHDVDSESHNLHRLNAAVKGKSGAFSFNLENGFTYIDGSSFGPTYPGALFSAWGHGVPRERREQYQDRGKVVFQYDQEKWFLRPNATLLYFDLQTEQINSPGYVNYADRYDVNGGVDFGYKVRPNLALTLGYRYGHQGQEKYGFSPTEYSSPSDYHRVLFGLEGKPWKWLTASLQAGPDFRSYDDGAQIEDLDLATYYAEAGLTAVASPKDTFTFKYKQWQWLAATGRLPIFDSLFDLGYTRKLTDQLSAALGLKASNLDYTSANNSVRPTVGNRNDWLYGLSAGLKYNFNPHFTADLVYAYDLGRNAQDDLPALQQRGREFDRHVVSLSAQFKF